MKRERIRTRARVGAAATALLQKSLPQTRR
jgi:hypothetical protein